MGRCDGSPENTARRTDGTEDGVTVLEIDGRRDSITTTIVSAVAERSGRDVVDLPPLQQYVDCDALECLFGLESGSPTERPSNDLSVQFDYADHTVTVDGHSVMITA